MGVQESPIDTTLGPHPCPDVSDTVPVGSGPQSTSYSVCKSPLSSSLDIIVLFLGGPDLP